MRQHTTNPSFLVYYSVYYHMTVVIATMYLCTNGDVSHDANNYLPVVSFIPFNLQDSDALCLLQ